MTVTEFVIVWFKMELPVILPSSEIQVAPHVLTIRTGN